MEQKRVNSRTLSTSFTGNRQEPTVSLPLAGKLWLELSKKTFMLLQLNDSLAASNAARDQQTDQAHYA